MITFGRPVEGTFERDGATLPVMRVPVVDDGVQVGWHEFWLDLADGEDWAIGTATRIAKARPETLAALGFRQSMRMKRPKKGTAGS